MAFFGDFNAGTREPDLGEDSFVLGIQSSLDIGSTADGYGSTAAELMGLNGSKAAELMGLNGSTAVELMGLNGSTTDQQEIFCGYIPDTDAISVNLFSIFKE